jgi:hypothetical protein
LERAEPLDDEGFVLFSMDRQGQVVGLIMMEASEFAVA